ncbi:MAG: hypothetical protein IKP10_05520 [Clostridia bacterium]|nr:hypothetical protein [Clostridia bacterium]
MRRLFLALTAALLFLACAAQADFHGEWLDDTLKITTSDMYVWVPKADFEVRKGKSSAVPEGMTAIDAYTSRPSLYPDGTIQAPDTRKKVYIPADSGPVPAGSYFDGDELFIRKQYVRLGSGEKAPEGMTAVTVYADGEPVRLAMNLTADEDGSRAVAETFLFTEIRAWQSLGADEQPPEGWTEIVFDCAGTEIRGAADLTVPEGQVLVSVGSPYRDMLASAGEKTVIAEEILIFRAVPDNAWHEEDGLHPPYATDTYVVTDAYPDIGFAMEDSFYGDDIAKTTVGIYRGEDVPVNPVAFFRDGRLWVQTDRAFRVLAEGEAAPEGWTVLAADLLDYHNPRSFLSDRLLLTANSDQLLSERMAAMGVCRLCPVCGGSGRSAGGRCPGCAEFPGVARNPWRIACETAEGEELTAVPVLTCRRCEVIAQEADKPLPEGWITVSAEQYRGVAYVTAADLSAYPAVRAYSVAEKPQLLDHPWWWFAEHGINRRFCDVR